VLEQLRSDVPGVRWARPETLHMTLHFFGAIDDDRVTAALDAVRPAFTAATPFEVAMDRLGFFPEHRSPRVLWLGASTDNPPLAALATTVRERLRTAGFAVEARPFRAHATLGRPREPWPRESRAAWDEARARTVMRAAFVADRAVLYESRTGREAAVYVERALLPFGAPA
jgi:2'-5' RNA ligase